MGSNHDNKKHHHILSEKTALWVGVALMVLTVVTVAISRVDLGALNLLVAIAVASVKALLVALIFMGLKYDSKENGLIFATSFLFLIIFVVLTATDLFFRGDVNVKGPIYLAQKGGPAKFKKPWVRSDELVKHGKELFAANCVSCHGSEGKGDGVASATMDPKPRNFSDGEGWKKGRKISQIADTILNGISTPGKSPMPGFANFAPEDRWAVAQYVQSLGPAAPEASGADLTAAGVDPTKDTLGGEAQKTIPVDFAIDRIVSGS